MTAEPVANGFRSAVLSGRGGKHDDLVVRTKRARIDSTAEGLTAVPVPRVEERRSNQRGGDRHRLSAEQALVRHPGGDDVVELVNLSAGGAMLSGQLDVMLWDHVGLVLGGDDEIDCAVRWIKGDKVGLEFAHETRLDCSEDARDELLRAVIRKSFPDLKDDPLNYPRRRAEDDAEADPESVQRRSAARHPLIWNGVVYQDHHDNQDYDVEPVRLRNISVSGALVQSSHDLPEGAIVYLDLGPAGKHEATVRWTRGGHSGLAFTELFDVQQLAQSEPEVAANAESTPEAFGNQEPWAPGWRRATVDEVARSLNR
jgi:PilZ domain-containing protein